LIPFTLTLVPANSAGNGAELAETIPLARDAAGHQAFHAARGINHATAGDGRRTCRQQVNVAGRVVGNVEFRVLVFAERRNAVAGGRQ
jgi:hypothetical protein